MPVRGDKLYRIWNGELETPTFIEESIAFGASVPTWVSRDKDGVLCRHSKEMYCLTPLDAWFRYLREAEKSVEAARKGVTEAVEHFAYCKLQLDLAERMVETLS